MTDPTRREPTGSPARTRPDLATLLTVGVAGLVVLAAVAAVFTGPRLPGHEEADPITMILAGVLGLTALLAATATLGHVIAGAWLTPRTRPARGRTAVPARAAARWHSAHRWSRLWVVAAVAMVPVAAASSSGFPLSYAFASFATFVGSVQVAQAWLVTAIGAAGVCLLTARPAAWGRSVAASVLIPVLALPVVVTDRVSVGAGHDLATDAAVLFTLASVVWFGFVWGLPHAAATGEDDDARWRRIRAVTLIAAVVAVPTRIGIGVFELAGTAPASSWYGVALVTLMVLLVLLAAVGALGPRLPRGSAATLARVLVVAIVGCQVAMIQLWPPRFLVPQSTQVNFLGFEVPTAPDVATLWLPGRPNLLLTVVAITAIALYVVAVVALRRRGDRWPVGRVIGWCAGWLLILGVSTSRLWAYSSATFGWHMASHMTIAMLAPPLLVLGGPITLALRCLRPHATGLAGPREALVTAIGSAPARFVMHPLVLWAVFVGGFYLLYFSPLFGTGMRYHWAHQLMTFHFLFTGYLFYSLAIGVDRPQHDVPAVARLAFVFAAMPFHAFFAIAVMAGDSLIGGEFYRSLALPWMTDLAADKQLGGQIAWATGELPLLVVIVALVAQWFRQDQRFSARRERAIGAGADEELEAYNQMLTELAGRDSGRRDVS